MHLAGCCLLAGSLSLSSVFATNARICLASCVNERMCESLCVCVCVCVLQCTMFAAEQEMSTCCLFIFSAHFNVKLHDFFYIFTVAVAAAAASVLLPFPLPSPLVVCCRVVWQFLCENIFSGTFEDSWAQQQGTHKINVCI